MRDVQNWIGLSDWTPVDAAFVPPAPERVPALMADLIDYINGATHSPLIQAAVAHAQFETIHPFTDGNGRVGRALVHTVLARRGLTEQAVLPISLVLATLRDQYVAGLSTYRHNATAGSNEASEAINGWLDTFIAASSIAVEQSSELMAQIEALRTEWTKRLSAYRLANGLRARPRAGSAVAGLLAKLPDAPVVTASTLARILNVSYQAANTALDELHQAGIVRPKSIDRGATAYLAQEVLDLITTADRALASTKFDTGVSAPNRGAPALPS